MDELVIVFEAVIAALVIYGHGGQLEGLDLITLE